MDGKKEKKTKGIITVLFGIYMIIVLRITVFRSGFSLGHLFQNGSVNLTLFQGYCELIRKREWFSFVYLFGGNIGWFLPFGMYLQYRRKERGIGWTVLYGFCFSLLIETLQYVFGTGFSELDDLVLNTLGALLGALLWKGLKRKSQGC